MKRISTLPPFFIRQRERGKQGGLLSIPPQPPQLITHLCGAQLTVWRLAPHPTPGKEAMRVSKSGSVGHQDIKQ